MLHLYNAVCGTEHTAESLLEAGDRIWNIERQFNIGAGIDQSQDTLPKDYLKNR